MTPSRSASHLGLPRYDNHSRLSLAQSGYGADSMEMSNLPSDDAILMEIKDILSKSDLMNVTKKQIKGELEQRFGCDLTLKKQFIGSAVESLLISGQLY